MRLSGLFVYPVKSCRGVALSRAQVTPRGLVGDRRFMVVDAQGRFVSQRAHPRLATVDAHLRGEVLALGAGGETLRLPREPAGEGVDVTIWGDAVRAVDCGPLAAAWFSELLGARMRLVHLPETEVRPTDARYAEGEVSFADGFPYLLATEASLAALERRVGESVDMARFRPNLVVAGAAPWEELDWSGLSVGEVRFRAVKPCTRCVMVTGDPRTGERASPEPLRTLAAERDAIFGVNAVAEGSGTIAVGDLVRVPPGST